MCIEITATHCWNFHSSVQHVRSWNNLYFLAKCLLLAEVHFNFTFGLHMGKLRYWRDFEWDMIVGLWMVHPSLTETGNFYHCNYTVYYTVIILYTLYTFPTNTVTGDAQSFCLTPWRQHCAARCVRDASNMFEKVC